MLTFRPEKQTRWDDFSHVLLLANNAADYSVQYADRMRRVKKLLNRADLIVTLSTSTPRASTLALTSSAAESRVDQARF